VIDDDVVVMLYFDFFFFFEKCYTLILILVFLGLSSLTGVFQYLRCCVKLSPKYILIILYPKNSNKWYQKTILKIKCVIQLYFIIGG